MIVRSLRNLLAGVNLTEDPLLGEVVLVDGEGNRQTIEAAELSNGNLILSLRPEPREQQQDRSWRRHSPRGSSLDDGRTIVLAPNGSGGFDELSPQNVPPFLRREIEREDQRLNDIRNRERRELEERRANRNPNLLEGFEHPYFSAEHLVVSENAFYELQLIDNDPDHQRFEVGVDIVPEGGSVLFVVTEHYQSDRCSCHLGEVQIGEEELEVYLPEDSLSLLTDAGWEELSECTWEYTGDGDPDESLETLLTALRNDPKFEVEEEEEDY